MRSWPRSHGIWASRPGRANSRKRLEVRVRESDRAEVAAGASVARRDSDPVAPRGHGAGTHVAAVPIRIEHVHPVVIVRLLVGRTFMGGLGPTEVEMIELGCPVPSLRMIWNSSSAVTISER
jgi:hypothetical protein